MGKLTIETKKDTQEKLAIIDTKGSIYFILAAEFNAIVKELNVNYDEIEKLKKIEVLSPEDLQTALNNQLKAIYTHLIGDENGNLSELSTENKENIIVAINEINALVKAVDLQSLIDDTLESGAKNTWSIDEIKKNISNSAKELIDDTLTSSEVKTYSINKINTLLGALDFSKVIDDQKTSGVDHTWSIDKIKRTVTDEFNKIIDNAPEDSNTLKKVADKIGVNTQAITQIQTDLNKRLRIDANQNLTDGQKAQGRNNLDIYSKSEVDTTITSINNTITQQRNEINTELEKKIEQTQLDEATEGLRQEMNTVKAKFFEVYKRRGIVLYSKKSTLKDYGFGEFGYKHVVIVPVSGIEDGETVQVNFTSTHWTRRDFYEYQEKRTVTVQSNCIIFTMYAKSATATINDTLVVTYAENEKSISVNSFELSTSDRVSRKAIDFTSYSDSTTYTIGTKFKDLEVKDFVVAGKSYNNEAYSTFVPENFSAKGLDLNNYWTMILIGKKLVSSTCEYGKIDYNFLIEYEAKDATRNPTLHVSRYNTDAYIQDLIDRGFNVTYDNCVFSASVSTINEVKKNGQNYIMNIRDTYCNNAVLQPEIDFNGISFKSVNGGFNKVINLNLLGERKASYTALCYNGIMVVLNGKKEDGDILERLDYVYLPIDLKEDLVEKIVPAYDTENYRKQYLGLNTPNAYLKSYYG